MKIKKKKIKSEEENTKKKKKIKRDEPKKKKKKIGKLLADQEDFSNSSETIYIPLKTKNMVSTGSTLLDLAISGGRIRGGGVPGGIMIELYGPSSSGKTAVLVELGVSVQAKKGEVKILDPEARLDKEYSRIYGLKLEKDNYERPDLVEEVFDILYTWSPENKKVVNMCGCDSIAALSTELEMSDGGDKRGQKKAKDLSTGCRKVARKIAKNNKIVVFTNQERDSEYGKTTPGGYAVGYFSSLRIRIARKTRITKEKTIHSKKVEKTIGIMSIATVIKSTVDDEHRTAPLYIIPKIGIDDVRANLQYIKDHSKNTKYLAVDKEFQQMDAAINYIENNDYEGELREMVIDLWEEIEEAFRPKRKKKKVRF